MSNEQTSTSETSNIIRSELVTACPSDSFFQRSHAININQYETIPPNIEHELNIAISIMQQGSFMTGDTLFDHLSDMIKLTLQKRVGNVMDYFEELSLNMRQQKFRLPEAFPWTYVEPVEVGKAKTFMKLMKIPQPPKDTHYDVCKGITIGRRKFKKPKKSEPQSDTESRSTLSESIPLIERKLSLNENIQRLQLYWYLCGFNLSNEEVTRLTYAVQKVQFHQSISHARFWGIIYGLKKSYYIVEADLIQSEKDVRFDKMREDVMDKIRIYQETQSRYSLRAEDMDLIPGSNWQNWPEETLKKMNTPYVPVPYAKVNATFDVPPEPAGTGLNRKTYFVVNSLNDEWIELPVVEPKQIQVSRFITKNFQGDLDANIVSYPDFPGNEKNYLRTMIARITCGAYVAPIDYYRKLTKQELLEALGENINETKEDDVSVEEEEEEPIDNDAIIIENSKYKPNKEKLRYLNNWVHVRPNIIRQGRVNYFDEKKALEALQTGTLLNVEEDMEEMEDEHNDDIETDIPEYEPNLFSLSSDDIGYDFTNCWSIRCSSSHNKTNQFTILASKVWPGSYSFSFDQYADTIYFGFGNKFTSRNLSIEHLPPIQAEYIWSSIEVDDPTVEMEEAYRLYHEKKQAEEHLEGEEDMEEEPC